MNPDRSTAIHNLHGSRVLEPHHTRASLARHAMAQSEYAMDQRRRDAVLSAIRERCTDRGWSLLAAHVRTNHVHIVISADAVPERIMNDLKSYASRVLNRSGLDAPRRIENHGPGTGALAGCMIVTAFRLRFDMLPRTRESRLPYLSRNLSPPTHPLNRSSGHGSLFATARLATI